MLTMQCWAPPMAVRITVSIRSKSTAIPQDYKLPNTCQLLTSGLVKVENFVLKKPRMLEMRQQRSTAYLALISKLCIENISRK